MLDLTQVHSGYGETQVLHGVDLSVQAGRVHALLGRNGVGKSTTLKTIVGQVTASQGEITFEGQALTGLPAHRIARMGIAYVPETRDIFGALSVRENLDLAGRLAGPNPAWTVDRVAEFFPNLANRMGNGGHELSGGEQQMLAIGRALMTDPKILILDEPTEGLAPIIIRQIFVKLEELKAEGLTVLLVEQNLNFALGLADDVSLMSRGQLVWRGSSAELAADDALHRRWLGV
ncbi:MAG: ABC transporter ATP-binding protein [Qingshengfaniella sp.]